MRADFVLLLPRTVAKTAGRIARSYAEKFPHQFVVDNQKLIPHISLFNLKINNRDWGRLIKTISAASSKLPLLHLKISRHSYYNRVMGGGWTGLKIKDSAQLASLRKSLFREVEKFNLGSPNLRYFSPHITLTKFKKHRYAKLATKKSSIPLKSFSVNTVGIGQKDKFGQIEKIIKTFQLR